jgi:hypothetical protein
VTRSALRLLATAFLVGLIAGCDANDADFLEGRYDAVVLELPRAADGIYDGLRTGGGFELTLEGGRVSGRYSGGRDNSTGEGPPAPFRPISGSYRVESDRIDLNVENLPPWFPRRYRISGSVLSAEEQYTYGGFRVVLVAR